MSLEKLQAKLFESDALRGDDTVETQVVDCLKPETVDGWPIELHSSVKQALADAGIHRPFQHQADAIRLSLRGSDVVLESPTASGKTLAFTAPMLHMLSSDFDARALMIYPMKALAFDQRTQIRRLCESLGIESWPYDGDTDEEHKRVMRDSPPQILLTNPEYLNTSFLAWSDKWTEFLRNLRFIVIDEMHEYRGFFGSNMALLLRRFFLHLERIGAKPKVFLSTATCANPAEHARNLTGREVQVVSARNVLRPRRRFLFVKPEIPEHLYRQILLRRIENAAMAIVESNLQALVFCPTKRFLEEVFRNSWRRAEEQGLDPALFSAFHADLNNKTRQDIQGKIKDGETRVVFTTNALELGLDIGGLDGVVLAGFPSNIMSAWQQIGRAGRGWNRDAFVLFFAMNDPIDRFFVSNIDAFLNRPFDHLVVDPDNEELIENHMASLVHETGGVINEGDLKTLGSAFYKAAKDQGGTPIKGYRPQYYLDLRGSIGSSYALKRGEQELGQVSEMRRFREAYIGAIFTFFGRKYRVHSHESDAVVLVDAEPNMRTDPGFFTVVHQNRIHDGLGYSQMEVFHGTLNFQMNFTGYKLVDERSGDVKQTVQSNASLYHNNLHAVWFNVAPDDGNGDGMGALENLFRLGAMFVIPADRFDTSTWSKASDGYTVYYYENYEGGIGVAKKFYEVWPDALRKGIEIADSCSCRHGCQNCIEPPKSWSSSGAKIHKAAGIALAKQLLACTQSGPSSAFKNGRMMPL